MSWKTNTCGEERTTSSAVSFCCSQPSWSSSWATRFQWLSLAAWAASFSPMARPSSPFLAPHRHTQHLKIQMALRHRNLRPHLVCLVSRKIEAPSTNSYDHSVLPAVHGSFVTGLPCDVPADQRRLCFPLLDPRSSFRHSLSIVLSYRCR